MSEEGLKILASPNLPWRRVLDKAEVLAD